jgi:hypothetical protein
VERAFRRLGVNPADPRQVLVQRTPSGGRHYYLFLDALYHLDQIHDLLRAAGLRHAPGEIEFFPSTSRALRLPFGHNPNAHAARDPTAWATFIDDYDNRRIRRFSLAALYARLEKHHDRWARQRQSLRSNSAPRASRTPSRRVPAGDPTKAERRSDDRYGELLANGIQSTAEAEELMSLGIRREGTRTEALKLLAVHLIWFRQLPADEAAATLTAWAMDPRHASKDIARDLAHGTSRVAAQIANMCRWYQAKKQTRPPTDSPPGAVRFAPVEVQRLRASLTGLVPQHRFHQAAFLLHFLAFARRHGNATPDGTARDGAPAVRQVIRRWPGCHHMNYKDRIDHAIAAGVLSVVREKWHNHRGPGRARTYRLHVPVTGDDASLDYDAALRLLSEEIRLDGPVELELNTPRAAPAVIEREDSRADDTTPRKPKAAGDPTPVHQAGAGGGLGPGPHQRHPQPDATSGLPRHGSRLGRADPPARRRDPGSGGHEPVYGPGDHTGRMRGRKAFPFFPSIHRACPRASTSGNFGALDRFTATGLSPTRSKTPEISSTPRKLPLGPLPRAPPHPVAS